MGIIEIHSRQTGLRDRMLTDMAKRINSGEECNVIGIMSHNKAQKIMFDLYLYDCECQYKPIIDSGKSRNHMWTFEGMNVAAAEKINGFTFYKVK